MEERDDKNSEIVVKIENIQKTYLIGIEGVTAVRGVSLVIKKGEFVCILGSSGGGKSSLLNIIGTIDTPSRGNLKLFGKYLRGSTKDSEYANIRLDKIGFVFQSFNLIGSMSAIENVELPMLLKGKKTKKQIRKRATSLLESVGLGHRLFHFPNMLSGGEQQRVTIARALSNEPEMLLMDEPTGDLDTKNSDNIINILMNLNLNKRITMIMVTHDEYMKQYADRVFHVMDGKIHREEIVPREKKMQAIAKLEETMKTYELGDEGQPGVRMGVESNPNKRIGLTEERDPMDYPFMAFQKKKRENAAAVRS